MTKTKEISVVWCGIMENSKSEKVSKWVGQNSFRWVLGNGESMLFREDVWCGNWSLKVEFPRLFRLATGKNSLVYEVATNNNFEEVQWDKVFSRKLLDRELHGG
ncbi:hypothetical protein PVK06_041465 [Gossypium arboreum]|uniref:Uncharacterized protein n=1 Tax=Gossypium arboreum TaxID=29729 RepID=A0ABR0N8A9_GOSAR|nr:hypothetical protein PVK06_041465 [Gossypium arboreum]